MTGIAEWNYDIPIVFKLLLSGNPETCRSSIWSLEENIAIVGDYASGVRRLKAFLDEIDLPEAKPLIDEALNFLGNENNKHQYFVLEAGEIFDMDDEPILEQNNTLLEAIKHLDNEMASALKLLNPAKNDKPVSFIAKFLGKVPKPVKTTASHIEVLASIWLGNWSNHLYYQV